MTFGPHLTLDLKGCPAMDLLGLDMVSMYLRQLVSLVDMTPIAPPYVFYYAGKVPKDHGVTGTLIIAESHISIHTFPEREGYAFIDIFSCKPFDTKFAIEFTKNYWRPEEMEVNLVERGKLFPRD